MRTGDAFIRERGYSYLLLLVLIAVLGTASSAAVSLGATVARRDAERHLLEIGAEFQQALASHAGKPRELAELTQDPRAPGIRRHLRRIPIDPLTGRNSWGVVRDAQGGIVGLHSVAPGVPLKRTGFDPRWTTFDEAGSYQQWVFGPRIPSTAPLPSRRPPP
ncbi:type II secretion system protein [Hydrogenophaga sp.]|uniref:type II secretion system protein n=1 Tax=Hydrogenophaga sp. TaxID=1904254 RepID=UPI002FCBCB21